MLFNCGITYINTPTPQTQLKYQYASYPSLKLTFQTQDFYFSQSKVNTICGNHPSITYFEDIVCHINKKHSLFLQLLALWFGVCYLWTLNAIPIPIPFSHFRLCLPSLNLNPHSEILIPLRLNSSRNCSNLIFSFSD